jgi:putative heme transporter
VIRPASQSARTPGAPPLPPPARQARPRPGVRHRLSQVIRAVAITAIVAGCAAALYAERTTIQNGITGLRHAQPAWIVAGFAAELASMVAFALLQQVLLRAGATTLTFGALMAITYTGNAITSAVPVAGSGMALAYTQRQFRARGADPARVSLALVVAGVVSSVAFAGIVGVGAVISGSPEAALFGLAASVGCAVVTACFIVILRSPRGRDRLQRPLTAFVRPVRRVLRRRSGDAAEITSTALKRLGSVRLSPAAIAVSFGCALVNWIADALCLAAAIAAMAVPVPWRALLLVWSAGAAAGSFSPTPYGLGVVDVALIVALRGTGLPIADAVGAVLLYRVITFKIVITLAWAGWQAVRERVGRSLS